MKAPAAPGSVASAVFLEASKFSADAGTLLHKNLKMCLNRLQTTAKRIKKLFNELQVGPGPQQGRRIEDGKRRREEEERPIQSCPGWLMHDRI